MSNKKSNDENIVNEIGAILYIYGKPVKISKIGRLINLKDKKKIKYYLEELKTKLEKENSFLKVVLLEDNAFLTIREHYSEIARKVVKEIDLPKAVVETLSVIAILSPVEQSEIIKLRNNKAYDHINYLEKIGFIKKSKSGRSYKITLTSQFFEYFDIDEKDFRERFKNNKELNEKVSELQKIIDNSEETNKDKRDETNNNQN